MDSGAPLTAPGAPPTKDSGARQANSGAPLVDSGAPLTPPPEVLSFVPETSQLETHPMQDTLVRNRSTPHHPEFKEKELAGTEVAHLHQTFESRGDRLLSLLHMSDVFLSQVPLTNEVPKTRQ